MSLYEAGRTTLLPDVEMCWCAGARWASVCFRVFVCVSLKGSARQAFNGAEATTRMCARAAFRSQDVKL